MISRPSNIIALIITFSLKLGTVYCQDIYKGIIQDEYPEGIPYTKVCLKQTTNCVYTNENGSFEIKIQKGDTIVVSSAGYKSNGFVLKQQNQIFTLEEDVIELDEVVLKQKTATEIKKEEGFSSDIIELGEYENTKTDINEVLKGSSGIVIRESGGLGSDFNLSLNGLSGKQVKFFIDGVPLDNFGSSFTPNNFPVNLISEVEVYKGVVPIHLGADALGGAINLVTNKTIDNYVDATYSIGSFNTHRLGLNGQYVHKDYFIRLLSFINYSDNNYVMDDIKVTDELGNVSDTVSVERFHDQYQSKLININTGVILKKWADRFTIGYSFSDNENNVQHDLSLLRPYGELKRFNRSHSTSLHYEKDDFLTSGLSVDLFTVASTQTTSLIDTSSKRYDWFGDYRVREVGLLGETSTNKSVFEFQDKILLSRINLNYDLSASQKIEFNYTQNYIQRVGVDSLNKSIVPFKDPHSLSKYITGLSHNWKYAKDRGNSIIFLKGYSVNYDITSSDFSGNLTDVDRTDKSLGYGIAQSFKIRNHWLAKFSYENAYRIPDAYEIFGDGFNLKSNTDLLAETSNNFNFGLRWSRKINQFDINLSENIFLRYAKNFIRVESLGPFAKYGNKDKVSIFGSESELKITFKERIFLSSNVTYQNITDSEGFRIANIPYLFGSFNLGYKKASFIRKENILHLFLTANLRQEFFLISPAEGSEAFKNSIPRQSSIDITASHGFKNNRYQLSVTLANVLNQKLYDNFRIQKPGRTFRFMFKYFLSSNKI